MTKGQRAVFGKSIKTTHIAGGRAFITAHYMARGADGRKWRVERHEWCLPARRIGWRAECAGEVIYANDLDELSYKLGHSDNT